MVPHLTARVYSAVALVRICSVVLYVWTVCVGGLAAWRLGGWRSLSARPLGRWYDGRAIGCTAQVREMEQMFIVES